MAIQCYSWCVTTRQATRRHPSPRCHCADPRGRPQTGWRLTAHHPTYQPRDDHFLRLQRHSAATWPLSTHNDKHLQVMRNFAKVEYVSFVAEEYSTNPTSESNHPMKYPEPPGLFGPRMEHPRMRGWNHLVLKMGQVKRSGLIRNRNPKMYVYIYIYIFIYRLHIYMYTVIKSPFQNPWGTCNITPISERIDLNSWYSGLVPKHLEKSVEKQGHNPGL